MKESTFFDWMTLPAEQLSRSVWIDFQWKAYQLMMGNLPKGSVNTEQFHPTFQSLSHLAASPSFFSHPIVYRRIRVHRLVIRNGSTG